MQQKKSIQEEIMESEMRTKRLRKYEPVVNIEIYEATTFGRGLEWDYRLYLGELEQSRWNEKSNANKLGRTRNTKTNGDE